MRLVQGAVCNDYSFLDAILTHLQTIYLQTIYVLITNNILTNSIFTTNRIRQKQLTNNTLTNFWTNHDIWSMVNSACSLVRVHCANLLQSLQQTCCNYIQGPEENTTGAHAYCLSFVSIYACAACRAINIASYCFYVYFRLCSKLAIVENYKCICNLHSQVGNVRLPLHLSSKAKSSTT